MSSSWEVVGNKNPKKSKIPQHVGQKTKQKFDTDSMPRLEVAPPVKESPTIYDAFMEKPQIQQKKSKGSPKGASNGIGTGPQRKTTAAKKKSDKSQDKKQVKSRLEDVVKELNIDELEAVLVRDQNTFPDKPSLWLMDLASVINLKLDNAAEDDPILEGKPKDYPLRLLPKDCKRLICDIMKDCSSSALEGLMEQCVNHMVTDMGKGVSTHGYRMFIQLLAKESSEIVLNSTQKYIDIIKNNQNRHMRCLAVMWAVGQVGNNDLQSGIQVWFNIMLPFLNIRALAGFIVEYMDKLFAVNKDLKSVAGCISERQFFQIFDLLQDFQHLSLPGNLQKKLLALYPKIKSIALSPGPEGLGKVFFPSFLKRCDPSCTDAQKTEMSDCMVTCLAENKLNYSQWRQMYTKSLPQSSILLQHLSDNWKRVGSKLDKKLLKETIKAFELTNEDLAKKSKNNQECDKACKAVSAKLNSGGFSFFWLFLFFFSVCFGVVAYDIHLHKTFKSSKTRQVLSDSGLLVYLEQAWSRIVLYSGKAWDWLSTHVPYYYSRMCEVVSPYLILFWEKMWAFGVYIVEVTQPTRDYLAVQAQLGIDWINKEWPWVWSGTCYYAGMAAGFIVKYALIAWEFISYYTFIVGVWLQENVFTGSWSVENIQKLVLSWLEVLRTFFQHCGVKLSNLFSGVNKS